MKRVTPTRMELLRFRRRRDLAKRGHRLLKDKLDGLIQKFLGVVKEYRELSGGMEQELVAIFRKLAIASALTSPEILAQIEQFPQCQALVDMKVVNLMGVKVPKYKLELQGHPISYGFTETSAELDEGLLQFKNILPKLVKLGELNKNIIALASAIIETKRRVNALEYILIPELEDAVRLIRMKLAEMERETIVSLMKIKELVRAR